MFPKNTISHGLLNLSDHRPLLLNADLHLERTARSSSFLNMWTQHSDFIEDTKANWLMPARGPGLKLLHEKLYRLKQYLNWWNKHKFGNIFVKLKNCELQVSAAESAVLSSPSESKRNVWLNFNLFFPIRWPWKKPVGDKRPILNGELMVRKTPSSFMPLSIESMLG